MSTEKENIHSVLQSTAQPSSVDSSTSTNFFFVRRSTSRDTQSSSREDSPSPQHSPGLSLASRTLARPGCSTLQSKRNTEQKAIKRGEFFMGARSEHLSHGWPTLPRAFSQHCLHRRPAGLHQSAAAGVLNCRHSCSALCRIRCIAR